MTREQTTPDAPKRVLDVPVPRGDRVRDDAGQRVCAVAGNAAGVQGGAGHVGAGSGDAAGAEGVAAGRRGELKRWMTRDDALEFAARQIAEEIDARILAGVKTLHIGQ